VIVGEREHLNRDVLLVENCTWHGAPPQEPLRAACRIRYRHQEVPATITASG
jgi:tRNA-uridine 2-sulfurtransferase